MVIKHHEYSAVRHARDFLEGLELSTSTHRVMSQRSA